MAHFDPAEQYKLHYKGINILNFMRYPFLLNIDYKNVNTFGYVRNYWRFRARSNTTSACSVD